MHDPVAFARLYVQNSSNIAYCLCSLSFLWVFTISINRVKWRHISVVAMRSPFCRSTRRRPTVCS